MSSKAETTKISLNISTETLAKVDKARENYLDMEHVTLNRTQYIEISVKEKLDNDSKK